MTDVPSKPPGFTEVPDDAFRDARAAAWAAVNDPGAVDRLRRYYDSDGNYAGATFVEVLAGGSTAPDEFTATDLFAVTLLSVDPPGPRVARRFLDPGEYRSRLQRLLQDAHLALDSDLAYADDATMNAMRELYVAVKETLGKDPWVTASKLCARKRPALFPVRDRLVRDELGLLKYENYQIDWQVFRALMLDHDLVEALRAVRSKAIGDTVVTDAYPLRWLDVLLWMRAREGQ
jgi:hypothetical protein